MGTIQCFFDGAVHQWDNVGNLRGWFTKEELSGAKPLPTQAVLDARESRLEELANPHDD